MSDLRNPNPDSMNYQMLSEVVGYFKKSKKGKVNVMTVTEKVYNAGFDEGRNEGRLQALFELLKDGFLTIEIAAKKANMSIQDFTEQMKLAGYAS